MLLTDVGDKNPGQSVTNAIEVIRNALYQQGHAIDPATFIEHYEKDSRGSASFHKLHFRDGRAERWDHLNESTVAGLLECTPDELRSYTLNDARLYDKIERLRAAIDPFIDSPSTEPTEVIQRRLAIDEQTIERSAITDLVHAGATERELQRLLKQDLSIFGEMYANLPGEYICFSEFPLSDGFVDFVVFTGRSRMDVVFIEIKGADFNLVNQDSYGAFAHKINQAADQIRTRLGYVYRNWDDFRHKAHKIRASAIRGESIHNAFLGPLWRLEVDPNKDITIRTVVIGGRTQDDLTESQKRHDYESRVTPSIKIESWDSWLRKIQRN